jgi:nucleotide-binding universal stress UspA family protein
MGTLVCAVEDSPEAAEALRVAGHLSHDAGLRLVVVHVAEASWPPAGSRTDAQQRGRQLVDRVLAKQPLSRGVDTRVEVGPPAQELARVAAEEAATLILVGSPSRHCWPHRLQGRVTAELVATADCPVVVVPAAPAH